MKDIRKVYGYSFKVRYVVENVSSMDAAAEGEISQVLGGKPLRLDPCHNSAYSQAQVLLVEHRLGALWTV